MQQPFDNLARAYDTWYDTPRGRQIFEAELKCLQQICPACQGRWLEIGVGTGRFASRLGIREGLDPSPGMLELACSRGITTSLGSAEKLPFEENTFDGILMAFTLCFIQHPEKVFRQCRSVLKPDGQLLVGLIPADSPWGKLYQEKKNQGHPIYSHARFLTSDRILAIAQETGFQLKQTACTLFGKPDDLPQADPNIAPGISEQAGFAALRFSKTSQME
ncbi:MAG: methyltransferase domain-containing protein [Sedimentisphaerales bacterium]|nr:methyltransferase domain-containing protein [Sedimentisphaerales bacterium]